MGIKSNRTIASYFNRFGATGLDAVSPAPVPVYTEATGGIISDYTDSGTHYRAHIFTSSGTFVVSQVGDGTPTGGPTNVEYLVVAGGGGGSFGGGGAGGVKSNSSDIPSPRRDSAFPVSVSSYPIVVGGAGNVRSSGTNSVFGSITANAGGAGGSPSGNTGNGVDGGSGGGGGHPSPGGTGGAAPDSDQGVIAGANYPFY